MKIMEQYAQIISRPPSPISLCEKAGRTCYKSEGKGDSADFVGKIVNKGHESVIEHAHVTAHLVTDRGVSHELVRHRLASYSQESTRYCNYSQGRFGNEITIIKPCFWEEGASEYEMWALAMEEAEANYLGLLRLGASPQEARSVLPNSLKTEVVMTANFREWKHIFDLRCSKQAHPQMRDLMLGLHYQFAQKWPQIFDNIQQEEE